MAEGGQDEKDEYFLPTEEESDRTTTSIAEKIRFFEGQFPLMGSEVWRKCNSTNHTAPRETTTVDVGEDREELEIADCKVTFDQGTFTDVQEVTITAEIKPENWPPGREAVTPMLHVEANKLLREATVKLPTWCAYDGLRQIVEVMRYDDTTKQWETLQFCTVSESRYIEFSVEHFSWVIAVLKTFFSASYIMRPIVYCSHTTFVLALLRDTKLQIQKFQQEMNSFFISGYEEKRIQAIECKKDDEIKTIISCIKPATGFRFLPHSMHIHSVRYIVTNSRPSYRIYDLASNKPSQQITIKVESKNGGKLLSRNCFGFCWNGDKVGAPHHHVSDIYGGKMVVNVHGTAFLADGDVIHGSTIGTLNKGEIHNENHGLTSVVTGQKHTTADITTSVEMTQERNCEREGNAVDSGLPNEGAKEGEDSVFRLEDKKRKLMLEEGDFIGASEILAKLQILRGHENVDDLLDIAVCELHIMRGRDESSLRNLKDYISKSPWLSARDVRLFGCQLARFEGRFAAAIILLIISHELRNQERRLTLTEETEWRLELLSEIREFLELLENDETKFKEPAVMLGKEAVEILKRDMPTQHEGYDDHEKSPFRDETDVQKQAEKEKEERMKILEDRRRTLMFEEVDFEKASEVLTELQKLRGHDNVQDLLDIAVIESHLMRNKEESSRRNLKDFISNSRLLSARDVKLFGSVLARYEGRFVAAVILLVTSHELGIEVESMSQSEANEWTIDFLNELRDIAQLLRKGSPKVCQTAGRIVLEATGKLKRDSHTTKDVEECHNEPSSGGIMNQQRNMTFEEHLKSVLGTLTELQQSGELEDVIGLLKDAVFEVNSMKSRENSAMMNLKDYISKSPSLSAKDVKSFGCKLARSQGCLLPAMIFWSIYHELRNEMKALSLKEEVKWRKELLSDIREILELSENRNTRVHRIAAKLGLEIVEGLEKDIRAIEDVKADHNKSTEGVFAGVKFAFELYILVCKTLMEPFKF